MTPTQCEQQTNFTTGVEVGDDGKGKKRLF